VDFEGVAAHAGNNPQDGRNAIDSLCAAVPRIKALAADYEGVTINSGVITGGTVPNTVAAHASVTFDLRYAANADRDDLVLRITELCRQGFTEGVSAKAELLSQRPATEFGPATESLMALVEKAEDALGQPRRPWRFVGGASDGNEISCAGAAVADAMGVCGGNFHNPEKEFLDLSTVESRIALGKKIVELLSAEKA
jgi:glutamate carboxypeptidase